MNGQIDIAFREDGPVGFPYAVIRDDNVAAWVKGTTDADLTVWCLRFYELLKTPESRGTLERMFEIFRILSGLA